jgi:alpha-ketoglutarate-dependent 2,4-dichlorophenoxyacetate dioxygenase
MIEVTRLGRSFAARVEGVDARRKLRHGELAEVVAAFHAHGVLIFPGQDIDDRQQIAFSSSFGTLEKNMRATSLPAEIVDVSNFTPEGKLLPQGDPKKYFNDANQLWHTDGSFNAKPSVASLLSGREIPPEGGDTEFADMCAAYDALPEAMKKRLEELVAVHNLAHSRRQVGLNEIESMLILPRPPVEQVLVRTHPATGRKSLYIASHVERILGLSDAESNALIAELMAWATRPEFVYVHVWSPKDLVMWDNRRTMHRARPFPAMRHTGVSCTARPSPGWVRRRKTAIRSRSGEPPSDPR